MKNVIIEARRDANLHIVHLEPICSFIEEIDAGFTKSITFEGAYSTILAYNRALTQPLTKSMFHAKTGLFEGFEYNKEIGAYDNGHWRVVFATDRIYLDERLDEDQYIGHLIDNPTLSDFADHTKDNPLKLRQ